MAAVELVMREAFPISSSKLVCVRAKEWEGDMVPALLKCDTKTERGHALLALINGIQRCAATHRDETSTQLVDHLILGQVWWK